MAAIVRVKRRVDDDPSDALFVNCKRRKLDEVLEERVFKHVGTVKTKATSISRKIKETIIAAKFQCEDRPQGKALGELGAKTPVAKLDIPVVKPPLVIGPKEKAVESDKDASQTGRRIYKPCTSRKGASLHERVSKARSDRWKKQQEKCTLNRYKLTLVSRGVALDSLDCHDDDRAGKLSRVGDNAGVSKDDCETPGGSGPLFSLYDATAVSKTGSSVELARQCSEECVKVAKLKQEDVILCNGAPMEPKSNCCCHGQISTPVDDENCVYDLYYYNSNSTYNGSSAQSDKASCGSVAWEEPVEAYMEDYSPFVKEYRGGLDSDGEADSEHDSEDSNAEDNWRNDYPDEACGGASLYRDTIISDSSSSDNEPINEQEFDSDLDQLSDSADEIGKLLLKSRDKVKTAQQKEHVRFNTDDLQARFAEDMKLSLAEYDDDDDDDDDTME